MCSSILRIDSDGTKIWRRNHEYHRIGGPALEWANGNKTYWLYGNFYTEEYYNKLISNLPLLYWNRFKMGEWI